MRNQGGRHGVKGGELTVRVARGLLTRLREYPGSICLQVQDASDADGALAAVEAARAEIMALKGLDLRFLTAAMPAGSGAFFYLDAGETPFPILRTLPDIVARHLEQAGVEQATIAFPRGMELWEDALSLTPQAVVLCAFLPPPSRLGRRSLPPAEWLDVAVEWVRGDLGDEAQIMVDMNTMQFHLPAAEVRGFFAQACKAGAATCHLLAGEFSSTIRSANGRFAYGASLALAAGGPAATEEGLLTAFDDLVGVARRLAAGRLAYAFVNIEPDHECFANLSHETEWSTTGGEQAGGMSYICDEYVLDAFPYQILSDKHLERLGGMPPGARLVHDGKVELMVGEAHDWLIPPPRRARRSSVDPSRLVGVSERRRDPMIQARARQLLAPCLLRIGQGGRIVQERYHPTGPPSPPP